MLIFIVSVLFLTLFKNPFYPFYLFLLFNSYF